MKNFETISTYDSIVFIESLGVNDTNTGLHLGYKLKEYCEKNHIVLSYLSVSNREQFFSSLNKIEQDIRNGTNDILSGGAKFPILHFDLHGNEDGLGLSNGEFVGWDEFADVCRKINKANSNNLVIVLAVCYGYQSIVHIPPDLLSPYYALIGPTEKVYEPDIEKVFPEFYLHLFKSNNITEALELINTDYQFYHCEMVFVNSYSRYIKEKCRGEGKEKRLDKLITEYKKMNPRLRDESEVRSKLSDMINPREKSFKKFRHRFLLSELELNKDRFSVKLDDILNLLE